MFAKLTSALTVFAILAVAIAAPNDKPTTSAPAPTTPAPTPSAPATSLPIPSLPIPSLPIPSLPIPSLPIPSLPIPSLPIPSNPVPSAPAGGAGAGSCSTGALQCCQSVQSANSDAVSAILGLIGVVLEDLNVDVGLSCSPISVVGVGSGNACSAQAVCCENNNVGGLLSIGCAPVTL